MKLTRSLRLQLVLWNALTLTALLAVMGIVTRFAAGEAIMRSVDQQLAERVRPPHGPHRVPRLPNEVPRSPGDGPPGGFGGPDDHSGPEGPRRDGPPPREEQSVRFFNPQGLPIRRDGQGPWDPAALTAARQGRIGYSNVTVGTVPLRVLTRSAPPFGFVQAAYPLTEINRVIAGLDRALLLLVPVALISAALGGALLTGRVLKPVRQMTQAAAAMGDALSARLPVLGEDEFAAMAGTFNGLLSRLEASFRRQAQILQQQRRFTADASHELKSPLTVIQGTANQISYGGLSESEIRHSAAEIAGAASRMASLVQDLLLLARADEGRLGQNKIELLVSEILVQSVAQTIRAGSPVRLQMDEETLTVCGNEEELIRLFANLLQNAAQATPAQGQITVSAGCEGPDVIVTVADTGAGIGPEHLAHLGERFYRADSARARRDGGTGLGLAICRGIVEAHGGTLSFTSVPGAGTTATVRLPA